MPICYLFPYHTYTFDSVWHIYGDAGQSTDYRKVSQYIRLGNHSLLAEAQIPTLQCSVEAYSLAVFQLQVLHNSICACTCAFSILNIQHTGASQGLYLHCPQEPYWLFRELRPKPQQVVLILSLCLSYRIRPIQI